MHDEPLIATAGDFAAEVARDRWRTGRSTYNPDHRYSPRPGDTWCRHCNAEPGEPGPHAAECWDCAGDMPGDPELQRTACANCDRDLRGRD